MPERNFEEYVTEITQQNPINNYVKDVSIVLEEKKEIPLHHGKRSSSYYELKLIQTMTLQH
ncbi:hypothetical protein [Metabacillus litoralis]|uniref:hypothetical protein n=1 Tax=Metabacillus litoralis TaxID=152268 RepID=UPI001CFE3BE3|nr:hypothetical protein [Metabacillus litoralis]